LPFCSYILQIKFLFLIQQNNQAKYPQKFWEDAMPTSAKSTATRAKPKLSARYRNDRAFWRLKPYIDKTYPPGQYIGIVDGKIVADDADFEALDAKLSSIEKRRDHTMVVQAGANYIREAIELLA
jgi:hypothetical protein